MATPTYLMAAMVCIAGLGADASTDFAPDAAPGARAESGAVVKRAQDVSGVTFRLAERATVGPTAAGKRQLWLLADFKMAPHWHVYWLNPGDSGIPTQLKLGLPAGVRLVDEIRLPVPKSFPQPGGFIGYGYEGEVTLAAPLEVDSGTTGAIDVSAA